MWRTLWEKIKEVLRKMIPSKTIESTLKITPVISNEMSKALELWSDMYVNKMPWISKPTVSNPVEIISLGLPAMIATEKARTAVLEMKSEITVPTKTKVVDNPEYIPPGVDEFNNPTLGKGSPTMVKEIKNGPEDRAKWLNERYQEKVLKKIRTQLEYGIAKGGLVIKPYVVMINETNNKGEETGKKVPDIEVDFIQADAFYPLAFNASGDITEAAFVQTKTDKEFTYRKLEYHKLINNKVIVKNRAFRAMNDNNQLNTGSESELGKEIPLTDVPEWKDLKPERTIANVDRLLFAYFKMPEANTIDPLSPLGVSGYSRAVDLIKQADIQFSRLMWEYQATEAAIDIDRDALLDVNDRQGNTHYVNPILQQRLFRPIDLGESNTYQPYLPAIRDASLVNGLNTILMRIEDVCAISRGTISDASVEAKTATEIKILKNRTYEANNNIQQALQRALEDVVYIMDVYATLYNIVKDGNYEASFEWDDSVLVDVDEELNKRLSLLQQGLMSKLELRMWYFGETEAQAREALDKVDEENRHQMEENIMGQKAMGESEPPQNDEMG